MAHSLRYFIITGEPGVGKTTLTKQIIYLMRTIGIQSCGIYTEEVRKNGVREGFDVVTTDGLRARLARDQSLISGPIKYKIGKYAVLMREFEDLALPAISEIKYDKSCLVIDEIGKMELSSEHFKRRVKEVFDPDYDCNFIVLATIPLKTVNPLIESIRNNPRAKIWKVTRENRNTIDEDILQELKAWNP